MTSRNEKRRVVRPVVESLEGRALLSATPVIHGLGSIHAATSKPAPIVTLSGKANGTINSVSSPSLPGVNTLMLASGLTSGLPGIITMTAVQETELHGSRLQVTKGTASFQPLAASTGSYLLVMYSGSGPVAKTGATQSFSISGKVIGGKGAYSAARGNFTGKVVVDPKLGTLSIVYTMNVRPVAG